MSDKDTEKLLRVVRAQRAEKWSIQVHGQGCLAVSHNAVHHGVWEKLPVTPLCALDTPNLCLMAFPRAARSRSSRAARRPGAEPVVASIAFQGQSACPQPLPPPPSPSPSSLPAAPQLCSLSQPHTLLVGLPSRHVSHCQGRSPPSLCPTHPSTPSGPSLPFTDLVQKPDTVPQVST